MLLAYIVVEIPFSNSCLVYTRGFCTVGRMHALEMLWPVYIHVLHAWTVAHKNGLWILSETESSFMYHLVVLQLLFLRHNS